MSSDSAPVMKKRRRSPVVPVVAATGFPISKLAPKPARVARQTKRKYTKPEKVLDWHETAKEVRHLGASGFGGADKRNYLDEEYQRLTGHKRKKHAVPLPIVRGIRAAAAKRQVRAVAEARAAGIVLPSSSSSSSKNNKDQQRAKAMRQHGPAPSIGFMKKGILQVKRKP